MGVRGLFQGLRSLPLGKYLKVKSKLLYHLVTVFDFLRNRQTVFHSGYTISHSHQQNTKFSTFLPTLFCCYCCYGLLLGAKWYLTITLFCIFLMTLTGGLLQNISLEFQLLLFFLPHSLLSSHLAFLLSLEVAGPWHSLFSLPGMLFSVAPWLTSLRSHHALPDTSKPHFLLPCFSP